MSIQTNLKIKDDASQVLINIDKKIDSLNDKVNTFNNTPLTSNASSAVSSFSNIAGTVGKITVGILAAKTAIDAFSSTIQTVAKQSDELSSVNARFNLMNDGLMTSNELWNEIYLSSMRSRGSIIETADAVSKLGLMTEGVFANNQELVQFSENLTKSFKIAGTSTQGINSAMLQLTQAMASGVLRGEELNAVFENAPLLIRNIANYMGVPVGQIRELASEGQITADIVKNAILGATDEINAQFESMPMRFDDLGTAFSNVWYNNFSMIQDSVSAIPQTISDKVLPVWDALTFAIFADLEGVQQKQQIAITETMGYYDKLAQTVSMTAGTVIDNIDAMKIDFTVAFEIFNSLMKKTLNAIIEGIDFTLDSIKWLVDKTLEGIVVVIDEVAMGIDKLTRGLTKFSQKTAELRHNAALQSAESWNEMNTYENRLGDKYFGVSSIPKLQGVITQQAIDKVLSKRKSLESNLTSKIDTTKYTPIELKMPASNEIKKISKDVSDISKGIDNLNGINKSIQEINEATYHNNIANQFSGNIQIVAYGVDEDAQKEIGRQTEEAIRRVFYNDFKNTQAMGVYT